MYSFHSSVSSIRHEMHSSVRTDLPLLRSVYPAFRDPLTGSVHVCIAWGINQTAGTEYYAFEEFSVPGTGGLRLFCGWIMHQGNSCMGCFSRKNVSSFPCFLIEDPGELSRELLPPQYRGKKSGTMEWERVSIPFL